METNNKTAEQEENPNLLLHGPVFCDCRAVERCPFPLRGVGSIAYSGFVQEVLADEEAKNVNVQY